MLGAILALWEVLITPDVTLLAGLATLARLGVASKRLLVIPRP